MNNNVNDGILADNGHKNDKNILMMNNNDNDNNDNNDKINKNK